jgi:hypothetical protein
MGSISMLCEKKKKTLFPYPGCHVGPVDKEQRRTLWLRFRIAASNFQLHYVFVDVPNWTAFWYIFPSILFRPR